MVGSRRLIAIKMTWKNIHRTYLIRNYKSLKLLHDKNAIPFRLSLPEKLETKKELLDFSKKINSYIAFPEIHTGFTET